MATRKTADADVISVPETSIMRFEIAVVGETPFIANRMSAKAKGQILFPSGRKNAAERASTLKHDPIAEFRDSPYMLDTDDSPTLLAVMASSFKGVMRTAALDLPGATKSQIGRLVWVEGLYLPIYGEPKLFMSVTRSSDVGRTPDIRTRAILPRWACRVTVNFVTPLLKQQTVTSLLHTGGKTVGVGDWRPEKGSGTFGQFRLANIDDPEFLEIIESGGRDVQQAAMDRAEPYDAESAELLTWFTGELKRRGIKSIGEAA